MLGRIKKWRHQTHLFQCKIAGSQHLLDLPNVALLCRLDGRSKPVQDTFESELFHIGPSDFPQLLVLFRFNGDEFYLLSTAPSQKNLYFFSFSLTTRLLCIRGFCALASQSLTGALPVVKICLISVNFGLFRFFFAFSYSFSFWESFFLSDTLWVLLFSTVIAIQYYHIINILRFIMESLRERKKREKKKLLWVCLLFYVLMLIVIGLFFYAWRLRGLWSGGGFLWGEFVNYVTVVLRKFLNHWI